MGRRFRKAPYEEMLRGIRIGGVRSGKGGPPDSPTPRGGPVVPGFLPVDNIGSVIAYGCFISAGC